MPGQPLDPGRRALIAGAAVAAAAAVARAQTATPPPRTEPETTLADVPLGDITITVERRGDIVLVGLNRPFIQNRLDPPTRVRLAETFYQIRARSVAARARAVRPRRATSRAASTSTRRRRRSSPAAATLAGADSHRSARQVAAAPLQAGRRRRARRHVEPRSRDLSGRRRPRRRGEHAIRPGREHARAVSRRRRDGALRPRGRLGQRDALHADRRSLERRGVVPDGRSRSRSRRRRRRRSRPAIAHRRGRSPRARRSSIQATLASAHQVIDPVEADALSKLERAVHRALSDGRFHRRAARRGRGPAAQSVTGE